MAGDEPPRYGVRSPHPNLPPPRGEGVMMHNGHRGASPIRVSAESPARRIGVPGSAPYTGSEGREEGVTIFSRMGLRKRRLT